MSTGAAALPVGSDRTLAQVGRGGKLALRWLLARARDWQWPVGLAAALLVTAPAWLPWIDPALNLWYLDDAENHLLRLYVFDWLIHHGVWYPRWAPDLFMGYGFPVLNYYAPGFYYLGIGLGAIFRLTPWEMLRATGFVAVLLGVSGAYALGTALWRRRRCSTRRTPSRSTCTSAAMSPRHWALRCCPGSCSPSGASGRHRPRARAWHGPPPPRPSARRPCWSTT